MNDWNLPYYEVVLTDPIQFQDYCVSGYRQLQQCLCDGFFLAII